MLDFNSSKQGSSCSDMLLWGVQIKIESFSCRKVNRVVHWEYIATNIAERMQIIPVIGAKHVVTKNQLLMLFTMHEEKNEQ